MSSKTALVTGATGLLGRQVVRAFERGKWNVKGTGYSRADGVSVLKVDLVNAEQLTAALDDVKYDLIHFTQWSLLRLPITYELTLHFTSKTAGRGSLLVTSSGLCSPVKPMGADTCQAPQTGSPINATRTPKGPVL